MFATLEEFVDIIEHLSTIWDYTAARASFTKKEDIISSTESPKRHPSIQRCSKLHRQYMWLRPLRNKLRLDAIPSSTSDVHYKSRGGVDQQKVQKAR